MKMKKRFLSILLSLVMVLGLMPGMSLTAYADGSYPQTYLIQATCTSATFYRTGTIVANTTLPYTFTGAQLWSCVNAGYGCDHIKKSGTNIEINGTNIKVTGDGTSSVDNYATSTGSLPFDIKVTKNITTVVDGYTGGYDSNEHGIPSVHPLAENIGIRLRWRAFWKMRNTPVIY